MKLFIKNMVTMRCKMIVKAVFKDLGIHFTIVEFGEVEIIEQLSEKTKQELKTELLKYGLELMDGKKAIIVEKIKNVIIEMIRRNKELPEINFSYYLSKQLNYDYQYLTRLFSEVTGITIEHYIISHKIEYVKELLIYNELPLSEIAWKLHYSSVAHLSHQFKKVTGLTPSFFKTMKHQRLTGLDNLCLFLTFLKFLSHNYAILLHNCVTLV